MNSHLLESKANSTKIFIQATLQSLKVNDRGYTSKLFSRIGYEKIQDFVIYTSTEKSLLKLHTIK